MRGKGKRESALLCFLLPLCDFAFLATKISANQGNWFAFGLIFLIIVAFFYLR